MLINKEGKVVNSDAASPKNKDEVIQQIQQLLKQNENKIDCRVQELILQRKCRKKQK